MIIKRNPAEIQSYLEDASNVQAGHAEAVYFPEIIDDVITCMRESFRTKTPLTVSGGGTGVCGGRIPFGGLILATDLLDKIGPVRREGEEACCTVGTGVRLSALQDYAEANGLFYPPDPTERDSFLGGTIATDARGARAFKYGSTRRYIRRLQVVLADGDVLQLERGGHGLDKAGRCSVRAASGKGYDLTISTFYHHAVEGVTGYLLEPGMDIIDLFIGSEGTLGIFTEAEVTLLESPGDTVALCVFFEGDEDGICFARTLRDCMRERGVNPSAIEYLDIASLALLREEHIDIPECAKAALLIEETCADPHRTLERWFEVLGESPALLDESWVSSSMKDVKRFREIRHMIPARINEIIRHNGFPKIAPDIAVPLEKLETFVSGARVMMEKGGVPYFVFGHLGDGRLHINLLPRCERERKTAHRIYAGLVDEVIACGGTVSSEHGVGKTKYAYLAKMLGRDVINQMLAVKKIFDPHCLLSRGNIFPETLLNSP
ncbi:MAG: FAD-binding oxidoreductase [Candidatus Omnitrophica bacterium]|nr:FAD-binding oxidoreductase [Candidatus Omnitrophota bacterium]